MEPPLAPEHQRGRASLNGAMFHVKRATKTCQSANRPRILDGSRTQTGRVPSSKADKRPKGTVRRAELPAMRMEVRAIEFHAGRRAELAPDLRLTEPTDRHGDLRRSPSSPPSCMAPVAGYLRGNARTVRSTRPSTSGKRRSDDSRAPLVGVRGRGLAAGGERPESLRPTVPPDQPHNRLTSVPPVLVGGHEPDSMRRPATSRTLLARGTQTLMWSGVNPRVWLVVGSPPGSATVPRLARSAAKITLREAVGTHAGRVMGGASTQ